MGFGYELTKQQVNFLVFDCGKEIVTTNLTEDGKNPRFCAASSPTGSWSITRVTPNKQVVEQITKNEMFILH